MVLMLHSSGSKSCALVKTSFIYFVIYLIYSLEQHNYTSLRLLILAD